MQSEDKNKDRLSPKSSEKELSSKKRANASQAKTQKSKSSTKKKPFWKKHFLSLFLLLLLIVSVAWGYFSNRATVSEYEHQISVLKEEHQAQLKDLDGEHLKNLVSTLALAVRSEMIAENMSQVNQYFLQTLKTVDVERVILVDPNDGKVVLSTNKKDEDKSFDKSALVETKKAITKTYDNSTYAATPIMGLNTQLGVLIIQID